MALTLALAASVAWGSSDFLAGVKARNVAVLTVLLVSQAAGLTAVLAALAIVGTGTPTAAAAAFAALAGAADVAGFAALYRGLAIGCMCIVAPISAAAAVVPLAIGVAAGDALGAAQALAVALVVGGVALAACERAAEGGGRRRVAAGTWLGLLAALCFGAFFVGMDAAADAGALVAVALSRTSAVTLLLAATHARRRSSRPVGTDLPALVAVGLLDALANVLFAAALAQGLVGIVSVLGSLYPLTTVALAKLVLSERTTRGQAVGVSAALLGVALITATGA
ncbi:MAG: EamA family transporter [Nocardioidaceae bacterium]